MTDDLRPNADCGLPGQHAGCHSAWAQEKSRADHAEARLNALAVELRMLAQKYDGISGHATHPSLDGKTLGGALRHLLAGKGFR